MLQEIIQGIKQGQIIPYIGAYALQGSVNTETQEPIPADSDSLIYAMNNGQPMAPKLMYEFPRAAMNLELKRGRKFISQFLTKLYGETNWTIPSLHQWLADCNIPYIIDINRDLHLQNIYQNREHTLIHGIARIAGTDYRFKLYHYQNGQYKEVTLEEVNPALPILFKPLGSPAPEPNYIASDADYVDYLTELMGGFSIPTFLKEYRKEKQYVLLGVRLNRDTERMLVSDIIYGNKGSNWALIKEPTDKERRFCEKINVTIVEAEIQDLLEAL